MTQHHHPGEQSDPTWASPAGHSSQQSQQWQGQAGQYYDPAQHYYDPNNPEAWYQAMQYPGGPPPRKPVYKRWWFITILVVLAMGLVAIALVIAYEQSSSSGVAEEPNLEGPAAPGTLEGTPGDLGDTEDSRIDRTDDGRFIIEDGGSGEQALVQAQQRIDAGYSHYGPIDLMDALRYDGYQNQAIEYALNNLSIDWNEHALGVAQRMGDSEYGGYSAKEIQEHLARSGFIETEVQHAMNNSDIDYDHQAVKALESYQETFDDYTDDQLRGYLQNAGFQDSEIDHAFDNID